MQKPTKPFIDMMSAITLGITEDKVQFMAAVDDIMENTDTVPSFIIRDPENEIYRATVDILSKDPKFKGKLEGVMVFLGINPQKYQA